MIYGFGKAPVNL